ncbi:MAG: acylphosphatase [Sphingobacterium sp.]|jgi:acylphosphatase|uniref:acylphosphatase n=1 Tax=unclassified Sphingobacterium TaxID=2609468 RepID=UPI00098594FE|nr:acylphosphatase [Sphingobacterium sp. CZ-UAM]MDF2518227.1 acylphosphatase [Sphingobacterium sp.]OOG16546.1 acylphosphatase [Sphingobacterium sp. CZ-UAM]
MKHLNISIKGKVQGVFFRLTAKAVADQVGVKGFVLNQKDGSVYIEAEGDDFALDSLLDFCQEGPEDANVEAVEVKEGELKGFSNFEVIKRVQS